MESETIENLKWELAGKLDGLQNFLEENMRIDINVRVNGQTTSMQIEPESYRQIANAIRAYFKFTRKRGDQ